MRSRLQTRALAALMGVGILACALTGCAPGLERPDSKPVVVPAATPRPTPKPTPKAVIAPEDSRGLNPQLARSFEAAQRAGRSAGHVFSLNSDYRTAALQQVLWDESVAKYGSVEEARKFVSSPWDSAHVRGVAIDIQGTPEGHLWLWRNQSRFGLCRRYDNEPWHFELQSSFPNNVCPPLLPSASEGHI